MKVGGGAASLETKSSTKGSSMSDNHRMPPKTSINDYLAGRRLVFEFHNKFIPGQLLLFKISKVSKHQGHLLRRSSGVVPFLASLLPLSSDTPAPTVK